MPASLILSSRVCQKHSIPQSSIAPVWLADHGESVIAQKHPTKT
jgi:hypothetical protein